MTFFFLSWEANTVTVHELEYSLSSGNNLYLPSSLCGASMKKSDIRPLTQPFLTTPSSKFEVRRFSWRMFNRIH